MIIPLHGGYNSLARNVTWPNHIWLEKKIMITKGGRKKEITVNMDKFNEDSSNLDLIAYIGISTLSLGALT